MATQARGSKEDFDLLGQSMNLPESCEKRHVLHIMHFSMKLMYI